MQIHSQASYFFFSKKLLNHLSDVPSVAVGRKGPKII